MLQFPSFKPSNKHKNPTPVASVKSTPVTPVKPEPVVKPTVADLKKKLPLPPAVLQFM